MKTLKNVLINSITQTMNTSDFEFICDGIQNWSIEEFAPEIENYIVNEFAPNIEKWVKEYLNNKQTSLHISDFCVDDDDRCGRCVMTEEIEEPVRKMGTVEPERNDEKHLITKAGSIQDDALAFIYGAIKKYGQNPEYYEELKEYIIKESKYIGED